ncbi:MAG: acyltransferase [Kiritimatiellaeota bacterium]|nr:acyltransferase [Kiritimatiellota bacterium]
MKTESVRIQWKMGVPRTSKIGLYRDLVIGRPGFWPLFQYELVTFLSTNVPGALGLWLRARLYPKLLKRCGRGAVFGLNTILRHPHKIELGDNVVVDDNCLLDAKGTDNAGIKMGDSVFIGRNSILSCKNGDIVLGDRVNIGFNCEVFSGSRVAVGAGTLLAAYTYLIGGDHVAELDEDIVHTGSTSHGIEVGENCWFGAGVKVLDNVKIGIHSIVGTGAVVTQDVPAYSIAVGLPAKVIRDRRAGKPADDAPSGG